MLRSGSVRAHGGACGRWSFGFTHRAWRRGEPAIDDTPVPLTFADLVIDRLARSVQRDGQPLELTRTEFDLLVALAERPNQVWTREQLGEAAFGEAFDAFDRTIDSHVKNLRRKLDPAPGGGSYVETVRGVGYRASRGTATP